MRLGDGGDPTLVFLHEGIADHRGWLGVMHRLAPRMDVVAYDRRGFGSTHYELEPHDQPTDLLAVLDAVGFERAVLVGGSRGGQIALDFALLHPDRVAALVLVAPGVSGVPPVTESDVEPEEAAFWKTLEAAESAGDLEALNAGELRLWLDGLGAPEGRVGDPARQLARDMNRIALSAESPGHESQPLDAWSRLGEVGCPCLVVIGDLDMGHVQARARELATRLPGARHDVLHGAAHMPGLEDPETVAALVAGFVDSSVSHRLAHGDRKTPR